ncbi:MAG TPA: NUDIX domain-containing protein [Naasia sp.]|jgi:8-oxo-dGTP diphosphatase
MLEPGELPADCIRREILEELGVQLHPEEVRHLWSAHRSYGIEHTFTARLDLAAEDIALTEGQRIAWFSPSDAMALPLAYEDGAVLKDFVELNGRRHSRAGGSAAPASPDFPPRP